MERSRGLDILVACLVLVTATERVAWANVFASNLAAPPSWDFGQQGPLSITYRLNEAATDVRIEVFRAQQPAVVIATLGGTTSCGLNSVTWDGRTDAGAPAASADDYGFRVVVSDAKGHDRWNDITPQVAGGRLDSSSVFSAQGVAAQTDQASPDFGCVFVNNSQPQATVDSGNQVSKQGIYVLTADFAWYGGSAASAYAAGKNDPMNHWDSQDDWSPNKVKIGLDDHHVYIGDSGAYQRSDDLYVSTGTQGGTATAVLVVRRSNHGRVPAAISVGTGAQRVLYGIDRDQGGDAYPDFFRWAIGNTLSNYTGQPVKVFDAKEANPTSTHLWSLRDFDLGTTGEHDAYFANRTYPPSEVRVFRTSLDGSRLIWSRTGYELQAMSASLGGHPYCCAIAVDEDRDRLAVMMDGNAATDAGKVMILRASDGSFVDEWQGSPAGDAATKQGKALDFDAAGNLLVGSLTDQQLRLWSPPDGPNSYTTTWPGTISVQGAATDTPPTVIAAWSRKSHGTSGTFDLPVGLDQGSIECRTGGLTTLVVTFDQPVQPLASPATGGVTVTTHVGAAIVPLDVRIQGAEVTVELPDSPIDSFLTIAFPGIVNLAGTACTSTLQIAVLTGDTDQNGRVDLADLLILRDNLNQTATADHFTDDVNCDGIVDLADLVVTRSVLNMTLEKLSTR